MYCKKCGAELLPEAAFCEDCGTPVKAVVILQKKNASKKGAIIFTVVLFAVVAVVALWFTGIIGGKNPDGDTSDTLPTQAIQTSEKLEPQNMPEPSEAESHNTDDSLGVNGESMQLSTTETPTAEDFAWFMNKAEHWIYGITPADGYTLEDFYAILGSWKGMQMIYDYDGTVLGYGYFTATFNERGPNVAATLDWNYIDWADGSHEELTDREGESMTGSFVAPTLTLGEAGNCIELIFYAMDGKQYAEGKWTVQSGEEVRVALVRP